MNWVQAKNIFIVLFTLINVFLFSILLSTRLEGKQGRAVIENTIKILKDRNIEIRCNLPDENIKMSVLKAISTGGGKQMVTFSYPKPPDFDKNNVDKKLLAMIKKEEGGKLPALEQFVYDRKKEDTPKTEYFYSQEVGDGLVFNNSVRAVVYSDRIAGDGQVVPLEPLDTKRPVVPIHQILLKQFVASREKIDIVYLKSGYLQRSGFADATEEMYIPVWRVITGDNSVRYFKAFSGEEVSES